MERIMIFFSVLLILILLIEFYVLKNWTRFTKERNWMKWTYLLPWFVSALTLLMTIITLGIRISGADSGLADKIYLSMVSLWIVPKIVIVPFLILKDISKFPRKIFRKLSGRRKDLSAIRVNKSNSRRRFVQTVGWSLAGIPFVAAGHGMIKTRYNFTVYESDVWLDNLDPALDGLKIVQISDIHAGSFISAEPFKNAVGIINSLDPDIITLTGDFVNSRHQETDIILDDFKSLKAGYGVFGCLGNHDHYMDEPDKKILLEKLKSSGVDMLVNENRTITVNSQGLQIAGVDNTGHNTHYADFDKAIKGLSADEPIVMLCHDPTNWDKSVRNKLPIDLMLTGHTHGGQIGMELFGRYISPVRMVYKQWAGLYKDSEQYLYVNRGLGTVGPNIRVAMPPEITLIRLRSSQSAV